MWLQGSPGPPAVKKFECPPDFSPSAPPTDVPFSLESLQSPTTELWLIKAPADFVPESLNGCRVSLTGLKNLKTKDGSRRSYQVLGNQGSFVSGGPCLLVPSAARGQLVCGPALKGSLNVCDGPLAPQTPSQPLSIPSPPPPQIPPGLRQRFRAFGGSPPVQLNRKPGAVVDAADPKRKRTKKRVREAELELKQEVESWDRGYGVLPDGQPGLEPLSPKPKKRRRKQELEAPILELPPVNKTEQEFLLQPPCQLEEPSTKKRRRRKEEARPPELKLDPSVPELPLGAERVLEPLCQLEQLPTKRRRKMKEESEPPQTEPPAPDLPVGTEAKLEAGPLSEPSCQLDQLPTQKKRKRRKEESEPLLPVLPLGAEAELGAGPLSEPLPPCQLNQLPTKKRKRKEESEAPVLELPGVTEAGLEPLTKKKKRKEEANSPVPVLPPEEAGPEPQPRSETPTQHPTKKKKKKLKEEN
ncbi:DNA-directed RNA polymerase I subunit RPA34 [Ornithorhynchus anatinus]|uniref:DNA-directed RNA polymerase I subunit RPA34 n=1 Tax=Ornithorhynchus anatinus TaxID=9258 RepID=A0A6I8N187_ORNAN|nr:DNA-directed RNA polymerase I subunit RPA34 [Ornithorhynchus anatinus]